LQGVADLELRVAANRHDHLPTIERAAKCQEEVFDDAAKLVAKWVPISSDAPKELGALADLVTRKTADAEVELLVMISESDVTPNDLAEAHLTEHLTGNVAIRLSLTDAGQHSLMVLTGSNQPDVSRGVTRRGAVIVGGQVYSTPKIVHKVSTAILGPIRSLEAAGELVSRLNRGVKRRGAH